MTVRGSAAGRVALVTGANAGIGFFTAAALAARGAHVILGCRSSARAETAMAAIRSRVPDARLEALEMDLSSMDSVSEAVEDLRVRERLDLLIANAGMVHVPDGRRETREGRELVLATNVLGHVRLVAGVLPVLERAEAARVVALGSLSAFMVPYRIDDLELEHRYSPWQAYAQSKIALTTWGFELGRRLVVAGSPVRALVAHPGYSIGGRTPRVPGINEPSRSKRFVDNLQAAFTQSKQAGARPVVRAALDPEARPDLDAARPVFYGPAVGVKGAPVRQSPPAVTLDPRIAALSWTRLHRLAGTELLDEGALPAEF